MPPPRSTPIRRPTGSPPAGSLGAVVESLVGQGVQLLAKKAVVDGLDVALSTPAILDAVAKALYAEEAAGDESWETATEATRRRWRSRARAATAALQRVFRTGRV